MSLKDRIAEVEREHARLATLERREKTAALAERYANSFRTWAEDEGGVPEGVRLLLNCPGADTLADDLQFFSKEFVAQLADILHQEVGRVRREVEEVEGGDDE